jgi:hypothetical protein
MDEVNYPIWKLESNDPEEAGQGEFCLRYMISVVTKQSLYLGQCSCNIARQLSTPIIAFRTPVNCVFCGQPVDLQPVPRVENGRWIFEDPNPDIFEPDDDTPFGTEVVEK